MGAFAASLGAVRKVDAVQARLTPFDLQMGLQFGADVALSGDTAVIGTAAVSEDPEKPPNNVYVFERQNGTWTQTAELDPMDPTDSEDFGRSVAIDGDTLLALDPPFGVDVYVRNGVGWKLEDQLTLPDVSFWYPGTGIAVSGDRAVTTSDESLDVFERKGGQWSLAVQIPSDQGFTGVVALSGDTVAALTDEGHVLIFRQQEGVWQIEAELSLINEDEQIYGPLALVGDTLTAGGSPGPYVFARSGTSWTQQAQLVPSGYAETGAALSEDVLVIPETVTRWDETGSFSTLILAVYARSGDSWAKQDELIIDERMPYSTSLSYVMQGDTFLIGIREADPENAGVAYAVTLTLSEYKGCSFGAAPTGTFGSSLPAVMAAAALALTLRRRKKR